MRINKFTILLLALFIVVTYSCKQNENNTTEEETSFSLEYEKFTLDNGLEVVLHEDHSDPIVAVATLMHVGSNREKPGKTGFAHFFEHMAFNDSENVPRGSNRKVIPEWGGTRNGSTSSDATIYYEVVPKDAFEKILWIDSDRLGYMINTVTTEALEREKQVVKNEKRQNYDNVPYGFTFEIIRANLYPKEHPYNWAVIGSLPDLQAATLEDVTEFYNTYYGPNNATLVIAGDIDLEETKKAVKKWFGEIKRGNEVAKLKPMPVTLPETKSLYFEDNFAKLPELRLVYPTVEMFHEDQYALDILGQMLSGSKKSPLYREVVTAKKLAPRVSSFNTSNELAGEFTFRVRANAGTNLNTVKAALEEGLKNFEANFDEAQLVRIKAKQEVELYNGTESVVNKAFVLANGNVFANDPAYVIKEAAFTNKVTKEDVIRVYNKYIKGKNYIMTSFVPKGQTDLAMENAVKAEVYQEEIVQGKANEEVGQGAEAQYEKTVTKHDRSEPKFGELPLFKSPEVWKGTLANGINVYGIENNEVPLVSFSITIDGGHYLDPKDKAGLAKLLGDLMMEGTKFKTSSELEEAIEMLGATIDIRSGDEGMYVSGNCLAKNFDKTIKLVEEIVLHPRWDKSEFERLKSSLLTNLKGREANPRTIAYQSFRKLIYGDNHILGTPSIGVTETINNISLDDLKQFYTDNISASVANIHVAGAVGETTVLASLDGLGKNWKSTEVKIPSYTLPKQDKAGKIFFIDFPGAKQSVIYSGKLALSESDPMYNNLDYTNQILGGGSSGRLFQTLRIEKGYTYGAYSYLQNLEEKAPFVVQTSVRANATLPSLKIIKGLMSNYSKDFSEEEVTITKNKILKSSAKDYEELGDKLRILTQISKYNKEFNYLENEQKELVDMSLEDFQNIIKTHIQEDDMFYLVVGDKETQVEEINKFGKGEAIELDIYGNLKKE
ncbi:insulinase family protein [Kordia sp. YSTF-M3]|uniref:Insulinase family protein n=1 Tax=Kordia aestuariivivens TaxID=2759037 RepID=A0ABR7Q9C4_9FLAO|nr:pitrilysin family protein [Kordia aestuariivivens]MBC8754924.1 insulinase family protein [Kordia aestuariivivens]